jgi:hypothetical protein
MQELLSIIPNDTISASISVGENEHASIKDDMLKAVIDDSIARSLIVVSDDFLIGIDDSLNSMNPVILRILSISNA